MAKSTTALALAAAAAILALASAAGPSERPGAPERRIALEARGLGAMGLSQMAGRMTAAEIALARRLDPTRHPDLWGRPAAWTSLDLDSPPYLPMRALNAAQAAKINAAMPASLAALAPAPPFVLTGSPAERARAELCMAQAIYYEAALEPPEGQAAVAQTILNRVRHPFFPKTVCGVVYEGASQPGCQFSFACDGSRERPPEEPYWSRARAVAAAALHGAVDKAAGSATYYHADYVFPVWGPQMVKIGQFGSQLFYRYAGPAGEVSALVGPYAGRELAVSMAGPPKSLLKGRVAGQLPAAPAPAGVIMASATPAPDPMRQRLPGETVNGRRIPTRTEIVDLNAEIAALSGPPATLEPPAPKN